MGTVLSTIGIALRTALVTLALTGIAYPLLVTAMARALFPAQAEGSLLRDAQGRVIGSALIAQPPAGPAYVAPRPSAAGGGWDPTASGGSNLGPTSRKLAERAAAEVARLRAENPDAPLPIPADLVLASASGLDPHVSPAAARWQAPRIAKARDVPLARVQALIDAHVEGRTWGILGEPRVNVLLLNVALDRELGAAPK